jgi:hypothetical protein
MCEKNVVHFVRPRGPARIVLWEGAKEGSSEHRKERNWRRDTGQEARRVGRMHFRKEHAKKCV